MRKVLVFNQDRCTGCRLCELICSLGQTETCNPERSRIRILRMEEDGIDIQMFCHQCEDPACVAACSVSALVRNPSTALIEIDDDLCIGCLECISACPYGGIYFDSTEDKVIKCNLCGGDPKCVTFCETKAIEFIDRDDLAVQRENESLLELERLLKCKR